MEDDEDLSLTEEGKRSLNTMIWLSMIFFMVYLLGLGFWFGIGWLNTKFPHDYPQFGSLPVPGNFTSYRYSVIWWFLAVFVLHYLIPVLGLLMLIDPKRFIWIDFHRITTAFITFGSFVLFFIILFSACWCNSAYVPWNLCHDYRYCCAQYPTNPTTCPNTIDCSPNVLAGDLQWNGEFTLHVILTGVFTVMGFLAVFANSFIRHYAIRSGFR